ncbi:MAG: energy-coupled thiamine transporter ThiT [Clostridia bacterium]|nr:energy-coupled thiamine transporter ThiT [Clostridia bacterium]
MRNSKVRILCECAVLVAMGTALAQVKLFRMPSGGSVTLCSMLPFLMIAYRHGTKWGVLAGAANVLLQIALGGIYTPPAGTFIALVGEVILDYVIAYLCLGFSEFFAKPFGKDKRLAGVMVSSFICCLIRFLSAFLSGFLIWGSITEDGFSAVIYSLTYNGSYMLPETALTLLVTFFLCKAAPKLYARQK